jgi:hypothetical protein
LKHTCTRRRFFSVIGNEFLEFLRQLEQSADAELWKQASNVAKNRAAWALLGDDIFDLTTPGLSLPPYQNLHMRAARLMAL